jgi:uncharacterized membrane protein YeiB
MSSRPIPPPGGRVSERLVGLDAARGLALAGMIIINVGPTDPTSALHRLYLLPYGRASIMFVVIAGIGMGFLLSRVRHRRDERPPGLAAVIAWRAGLLVVGGFALQALSDDIGIILPLYGVLFALAPLLDRLSDRALVVAAVGMLVVGPLLVIAHDLVAGAPPGGNAPVQVDDPPADLVLGFLFAGRYPLVTWVVPFLAGLRLARTDLGDPGTQRRLMLWGAVAAVGGFLASEAGRALLGPAADVGFARMLTGVAHGQMPLWLVSSVGGAVAVVALLARVGLRRPRLLGAAAACGQLSLTVYVLHVLVLVAITPADGFTFGEGVAVSAALITASVALALLWRRVGGPGPLERVMRAPWARGIRSPGRREPAVHPSPSGGTSP